MFPLLFTCSSGCHVGRITQFFLIFIVHAHMIHLHQFEMNGERSKFRYQQNVIYENWFKCTLCVYSRCLWWNSYLIFGRRCFNELFLVDDVVVVAVFFSVMAQNIKLSSHFTFLSIFVCSLILILFSGFFFFLFSRRPYTIWPNKCMNRTIS